MSTIRTRLGAITSGLPPTFWFLWLGTVVNRLGGFVFPFLSLYLTSQRGVPVSQAGLVVAMLGAGSFAAQLAGGELADRMGRRPLMLLSLFLSPPVVIALGIVRNLAAIAALTLLLGFVTDLYRPAAHAAIVDLVPPAGRVRAFAYMYWAINLGAALAPVLAGFMAHLNYLLLFIGDALTTFVYGLIVLWRVPETQPPEAAAAARVPAATRIRQLGREPILLVFTLLALFGAAIYAQGNVTLPLDMLRHGLTTADYGLAIAVNGILIVLITIQVSKVVGKWPRFGAVAIATVLIGLGFGLNGFARSLPLYAGAVIVWTLGEIIMASVAPTIIADLSPPELRGLYQGIFGSAWGLAFFIGPLLGSWIFERFSPNALWAGCAALGCVLGIAYLSLASPAHRRLARQ